MAETDCLRDIPCHGNVGSYLCGFYRNEKGAKPVDFDEAIDAVTPKNIMRTCKACPVFPAALNTIGEDARAAVFGKSVKEAEHVRFTVRE